MREFESKVAWHGVGYVTVWAHSPDVESHRKQHVKSVNNNGLAVSWVWGWRNDRGRTAVIASLGRIGQSAIAHYALLTGGQLERVPNAAKVQKSRSWRVKSHAFSEFCCALWGGGTQKELKKKTKAHRSARHIDAERMAAVKNVPNEVRRRAGKRACCPVKEL